MPGASRRYGLLLPHFGEQATRPRLMRAIQQAERYGFDSVWVRDHIVFHPHRMEPQDRTFIDPFIVLGMAAALTERITLGTASIVPHRHPIHTKFGGDDADRTAAGSCRAPIHALQTFHRAAKFSLPGQRRNAQAAIARGLPVQHDRRITGR